HNICAKRHRFVATRWHSASPRYVKQRIAKQRIESSRWRAGNLFPRTARSTIRTLWRSDRRGGRPGSGFPSKRRAGMTLYDVLGIPASADANTVKDAFRRFAKANHPDLNPTSAAAARRFKQVAAAYDVLKDPRKRADYDCRLEIERIRVRQRRRRIVGQCAA